MATEAQKKARDKYNAQRKNIMLNFPPAEYAMYEHIKSQSCSMQAYIKELVRADMEKSK